MASGAHDKIEEVAYRLLLRAAAMYPMTFMKKIVSCYCAEKSGKARSILKLIIYNVLMGAEKGVSICQDMGVPVFHVFVSPHSKIEGDIKDAITNAVVEVTRDVPLRKNVIDLFTFENSGNNTGWRVPVIHYHHCH